MQTRCDWSSQPRVWKTLIVVESGKRAGENQRFLDKKEEAWELLRSQGLRPKRRKEFENDFNRNVMPRPFRDIKEDQRSLQKWTDELQTKAREEE